MKKKKLSKKREVILWIIAIFIGMNIIELAKAISVLDWVWIAYGIVGMMPPAILYLLVEEKKL